MTFSLSRDNLPTVSAWALSVGGIPSELIVDNRYEYVSDMSGEDYGINNRFKRNRKDRT